MDATALNARYVDDAVTTASPARLVTMLYDRLLADLDRGAAALRSGDRETASQQLLHAQDIVLELRLGLRPELWEGGPALASLYAFLLDELVQANVHRQPERVDSCRRLVEPLRDAWHQAANQAGPTRSQIEVVA